MSGTSDPAAVVESFIKAYNEQDFDGMRAVLADNLSFAHWNKGFSFQTADELIATLRAFANDYLPDRQLGTALRVGVAGDRVYREQMWTGTLAVDLPGFGSAGEAISHRLCSVFTVGPEGTIVEYMDYG
jgi:limonene-1,2-epoxide hydrolase